MGKKSRESVRPKKRRKIELKKKENIELFCKFNHDYIFFSLTTASWPNQMKYIYTYKRINKCRVHTEKK